MDAAFDMDRLNLMSEHDSLHRLTIGYPRSEIAETVWIAFEQKWPIASGIFVKVILDNQTDLELRSAKIETVRTHIYFNHEKTELPSFQMTVSSGIKLINKDYIELPPLAKSNWSVFHRADSRQVLIDHRLVLEIFNPDTRTTTRHSPSISICVKDGILHQ